jgi:cell pole-organizing protein PopZ
VPRSNLFKIGVATAAAATGAILALTSVFAHTTPTVSGHSLVGSIVNAEIAASFPLFTMDPAPTTITNEQAQDAIEAADLAAKIAAQEAAELAAKQAALAAQQAEEAAEAAPNACVVADQAEDLAENAADKIEDAAETNGTESPAEDAGEKTARQAADKPEAPEVKCAGAPGALHPETKKLSVPSTFSFKGEH